MRMCNTASVVFSRITSIHENLTKKTQKTAWPSDNGSLYPLSCPITGAFKLAAETIPALKRGEKKTASAIKDVGD